MILVDGGMRGTTNPTFAGAIQEAAWPSKLKRPPHDTESHYIDFLVDVPSAGGTTYLGYLSYGITAFTLELRIFEVDHERQIDRASVAHEQDDEWPSFQREHPSVSG